MQIPISGGWANIKSGEYTTIVTCEKDPLTGKINSKKTGGGGPIWNNLYYITIQSKNQKTSYSSNDNDSKIKNIHSTSQEKIEKLIIPQQRDCYRCGNSIKFKSPFYDIENYGPNGSKNYCTLRQVVYDSKVPFKKEVIIMNLSTYGNDYNSKWMSGADIFCNKICAVKYAYETGLRLINY